MTAVAVEPAVALAPPRSPYRGLTPFGGSELDALLFFGRRYESDVIAENLVASPLTVLYGPSGVGKSSVLRAGVARALREWAEPGRTEPEVAFVASWAGSPLTELVGAPVEQGSLPDAVGSWAARRSGETYLVLDQFEEFFLYHDADEAAELAEALAELHEYEHARVNVLISIREDALAKLDVFKGRLPGLFANVLRLDRLDRAAGREAIVRPVETYNLLVEPDERVTVEPALVAAVLGDVTLGRLDVGHGGRGRSALEAEADRVEAPFLQLVMERLWDEERRSGSRQLRLATLERLGGAERIVRDHVESALAALSAPEQDWASRLFNQLVTPSGTKIAHDASDLARYAGAREDEVAPVLDELTRARVLRPVATDDEGRGSYEIFHDVLAGPVLAWHARHETERALAEERARARRRNRRALGVAALALIGLLLMTGVAVYALSQRSEAQRQTRVSQVQRQRALDLTDLALGEKKRANKAEKTAKANAIEARRSKKQADAAKRRAVSARKTAQANAATAAQQEQLATAASQSAKTEADNADAARRRAVSEAQRATNSEAEANSSAAQAKRAAKRADKARAAEHRAKVAAKQSAKDATREKQHAESAASQARAQARQAQANALAANAARGIADDPEESIKQALDALQMASAPGIADVLRDALAALNVQRIFRAGGGRAVAFHARRTFQGSDGGAVLDAGFSPDGKLVVTSSSGGLARVLSVPAGRLVWAVRTGSHLSAGASFSPDGKTIATPGADGAVRLWDLHARKLLRTLSGGRTRVTSATFSHGGGLVAATSIDGTLRIWDAASGGRLGTYTSPRLPTGLPAVEPQATFSATDRWLATGGIDRFVRVYDVRAGTLSWSEDQGGRVNRVAFALSGDTFATGGADNLVRTWDAGTGLLLRTMRGHTWQVTDVEFSRDGRSLVSASLDWTVRVWDAATGIPVSTETAHEQRVRRASFSPDGKAVVTASEDKHAFVFNASSGTLLARLAGHDDTVNNAVFSPGGRFVVTASDDGSARLWEPRRQPELRAVSRQKGRIASVAFSPDGQTVASASADGTVRLWRLGKGAVTTLVHGGPVNGADFSRDGSLLLTSSADGAARLWRLPGATPVRRFPHGAPVTAAALSRDAQRVATAGSDGFVRLWSAATGRLLRTIPVSPGLPLSRVAFTPDGRLLAVGGAGGTVSVYGVSDGRLRYSPPASQDAGPIISLSFSPDGRQLLAAAANDKDAHVWRARTGRHEFDLEEHTQPLTSASFDPRGKLIVTTSKDGDGRLWNAANGTLRKLLRAHNSTVGAAAFSADGRWVVTAGPGNAGIWSVATGSRDVPLAIPQGHEILLTAAAFSPRGWRIVTGSTTGGIETFDCVLCGGARQLKSIARSRLAKLRPR